MSEPNEPEQPAERAQKPEFSNERIAEMAELSSRADLVEETTLPDDEDDDGVEDGEQ